MCKLGEELNATNENIGLQATAAFCGFSYCGSEFTSCPHAFDSWQ